MNINTKLDSDEYDSDSINRRNAAPQFKRTTMMKYMKPRNLGLNISKTTSGSLRNFALPNSEPTLLAPTITTDYGLAGLVHNPPPVIPPINNVDTEHIINDYRELSKLNEALTENMLLCRYYEVCNRAVELQSETCRVNENKNSLTIEKMFQTEIDIARQILDDTSYDKQGLKKKIDDINEAIKSNDQHYQQLLAKRNTKSKELFENQRLLAQNRAESEFLRCRIQQMEEEIKFYTLKNTALQQRQHKLHCELEEEIHATQVVQYELEVLQNEQITNEDIHLASLNDHRQLVNVKQSAIDAANNYREQLFLEYRRIKSEYEKKNQSYRDDLLRKFDFEHHRLRIQKMNPAPNVTREHEQSLEQLHNERKDAERQIRSVRDNMNKLQSEIERYEQLIESHKMETGSELKLNRHLAVLQQVIHDKEKQLNEAKQVRQALRRDIENFKHKSEKYSLQKIDNTNALRRPPRSFTQEITREKNEKPPVSSATVRIQPRAVRVAVNNTQQRPKEEGTLVRFIDFNVEKDCHELNRSLERPNIDEINVIKILCNRTVAQRLQIRETYRNLFDENLTDIVDSNITSNAKVTLKILLLSPTEYDCFELRRVLKSKKADETIFIELFLTRTNKEIKAIVDYYTKTFKSNLEDDIIGDQETPSKQIILALLKGNRPEDNDADEEEVLEDAQWVHETAQKWRQDGSTFIRLLCNRSNENLKQIFATYQKFSGMDIENAIQLDRDTNLSRILISVVRIIRNRARFFAYELTKYLKDPISNQENVTRIIISRCEIDMVQIKSEFENITKRSLFDHIQTDMTGNLKRILLELLRQRLEVNNDNSSFKQRLEASLAMKRPRPVVQWKEPLQDKAIRRSISSQDIPNMTKFDLNNQGKTNTLLKMTPNPGKMLFREGRPIKKRTYSGDIMDE